MEIASDLDDWNHGFRDFEHNVCEAQLFARKWKIKINGSSANGLFLSNVRPNLVKASKSCPFNVTMHAPRKLIEARRYSNIEYYTESDQLVLINN